MLKQTNKQLKRNRSYAYLVTSFLNTWILRFIKLLWYS